MEPVASDVESLDIPGLVVGRPGAGVGLAIFVSLWRAAAHESRARGGWRCFSVSMLVVWRKSVTMYESVE